MSITPMLITDTIGDAGRLLVTPYMEEVEVRSWLDAATAPPPGCAPRSMRRRPPA